MRRVDVVRDREETKAKAWRSIFAEGGRKDGLLVSRLIADSIRGIYSADRWVQESI